MNQDIHNPVERVKISTGELVEVRELVWKDCLRAVKEMTDTVLELLGPGGGTLVLDKDKIVRALGAQENLVTWVLEKSTGRTQEWVNALSGRDALCLLRAAVDLNLSDEVLAAGKALAGRMGAVFGQKSKSPAQSTA